MAEISLLEYTLYPAQFYHFGLSAFASNLSSFGLFLYFSKIRQQKKSSRLIH